MPVPVWIARWTPERVVGAVFTSAAAIALIYAVFSAKSVPPVPVSAELKAQTMNLEYDLQAARARVASLGTEIAKVFLEGQAQFVYKGEYFQ